MRIEYTGKLEGVIQRLLQLDNKQEYDVVIDEHRAKRSLSANAYCWVLISKIAARTRQTKEQVYFKMLQDYGIGETFEISSNVMLDNHFKYYEVLAERNNKKVVRSYVGTSNYNSSQMAQFIDGVVDTAKEMHIETLTPQELARMKEDYR